jgi:ribose transport system permease protein
MNHIKNVEAQQGVSAIRTNISLRHLDLSSLRDYGIAFSFVLLFLLLSFSSPVFLTKGNLLNIVDQSALIGVIAAGGTLVMIAGGLDISTAAIFSFVGVVNASVALRYGVIPGMITGICAGMILGAFNGFLVTVGRINAIIATLATSILFRGIALALTKGFLIYNPDPAFAVLGRGSVGSVQFTCFFFACAIAILWFILSRTTFGRYIYATGGNAEAAKLSGVRTKLVTFITFIISGFTCSIAGLIMSSRVATGQADSGQGMEISAIAAIVIGGTSIAGGEGSAWRTAIGVLLLTLIGNGFNLLDWPATLQQAFRGLIILIAVAIDAWSRKRAQ